MTQSNATVWWIKVITQIDDRNLWHKWGHKLMTQTDETDWWKKGMTHSDATKWWHKGMTQNDATN